MSNLLRDSQMTSTIPTDKELIQRARDVAPMLRERVQEFDDLRKMPEDVVTAFTKAGFFKILQPKRWGGYEMEVATFLKVVFELARGSGSGAWVAMILGTHQWEMGFMSQQAGDDVWGEDNSVLLSSAYAPAGKVTPVDGGYRLSGEWKTSSGCDHADWAIVGGLVPDAKGGMVMKGLLAPRNTIADDGYVIKDDWFTFGLSGTGSCTLVFNDVFVPEHRTHDLSAYNIGGVNCKSYNIPFRLVFVAVVSSVIVGLGQGAIDVFTEQMKEKKRTGFPGLVRDDIRVRTKLGHAQGTVDRTKNNLLHAMREAHEYAVNSALVPEEELTRMLGAASAGEDILEVVIELYKLIGPSAIFNSHPYKRVLLDTLAAVAHPSQRSDENSEALGGMMFGLDVPTPEIRSDAT